MSIPKEPRQLMINIMYLVLTALLALNVSAEIFNAFKVVDKGLVSSNKSLDESNANLPAQIKERANKDIEKYQTYADRTDPATTLSKEFSDYIDDLVNKMIDEAGDKDGTVGEGDYVDVKGVLKLRGEKDKDVTTRMLVNDGEGAVLKAKILEYHEKFLELIDEEDQADFSSQIALKVDDETWTKGRKKIKSWEEFNFKQMPLQAAIPILTKFKNDAKSSEAAILNYLINKVGGEEIEFKNFKVVSSPKKSYIIRGETFSTDIFVSATASNIEGVRISVNGSTLPQKDGIATYSVSGNSTGVKKYTARIDITNPVTGEVTTEQAEFEYEVGLRSATISLDKMNVFYVGVPNPISVTAAGVSSNDLRVSGSEGLTLTPNGKGKFNVTATRPGLDAKITLSGGGLTATSFSYKTKPIPPPLPRLGSLVDNSAGTGTFKVHAGVGMNAILENFDFDIKCDIVGFTLVHAPKRVDPSIQINRGGKLVANSMALVNKAKPGDRYFFENIRCKCPGWQVARKIGDIAVSIK